MTMRALERNHKHNTTPKMKQGTKRELEKYGFCSNQIKHRSANTAHCNKSFVSIFLCLRLFPCSCLLFCFGGCLILPLLIPDFANNLTMSSNVKSSTDAVLPKYEHG